MAGFVLYLTGALGLMWTFGGSVRISLARPASACEHAELELYLRRRARRSRDRTEPRFPGRNCSATVKHGAWSRPSSSATPPGTSTCFGCRRFLTTHAGSTSRRTVHRLDSVRRRRRGLSGRRRFSSWLLRRNMSVNMREESRSGASAVIMPLVWFVPSAPVGWAISLISIAYFGQQSWSTLGHDLAHRYLSEAVGRCSGWNGRMWRGDWAALYSGSSSATCATPASATRPF